MPQTLSQIRDLLTSHGLSPKHRFGQNFLHDANKMKAIMAAAEIGAGDLVLEVGPGTGTLTTELLEAGAKVGMVEIDSDLRPILELLLARFPRQAALVVDDILQGKHQVNPRAMAMLESLGLAGAAGASSSGEQPGGHLSSFKLIANLPYHVASPLLVNMAADEPRMSMAVVMVQKEVALRLKAGPGGKDYGALGIMVQAMCEVDVVATLGPGCFWPPPSVDSMVVRLRRRAQPLTTKPRAFSALLQTLFRKRRKQLGSILGRGRDFPSGIGSTMRPEELVVEQFVELLDWWESGEPSRGGRE